MAAVGSSTLSSVLGAIGNTPLVEIHSFKDELPEGTRILAKLEMQNPGGSVKDRIALYMIEEAEKRGDIKPGVTTIVEGTSGNTGIGLAMVAAAKGYKCILAMPQLPPMTERYMIDRMFGAQVVLTRPKKGINGVLNYVKQLCKDNANYWTPSQFDNLDNPKAHYEGTGPEIWAQTGGKVDHFVAGAGTGGTLNGVGRFLREKNPDVDITIIEPTESRVLTGAPPAPHALVGIGAGVQLPLIEMLAPGQEWSDSPRGIIGKFAHCNTAEGVAMCKHLASKEGLLVGPTSGAAMKVALETAKAAGPNKTIVTIFPSSAIRYVSHPLWADVKAEVAKALPSPPDMSDGDELIMYNSAS